MQERLLWVGRRRSTGQWRCVRLASEDGEQEGQDTECCDRALEGEGNAGAFACRLGHAAAVSAQHLLPVDLGESDAGIEMGRDP